MSQTVRYARTRASQDPDRTNTDPGTHYGNNATNSRAPRYFTSARLTFTWATRYGATVAPAR